MHRPHPLLIIGPLIFLVIGIFSPRLYADVEEPDLEQLEKEHLVYVEPTEAVVTRPGEEFGLQDYAKRRGRWGVLLSAAYNSYEPINYAPAFADAGYHDVYSTPSTPMMEFHFQVKRNLAFGSLGLELVGGTFANNNSDDNFVGSSLSLTQVAINALFNMDMLFKEPYVVPYIGAGAYVMIFSESLGGQGFNGNTQPAPYLTLGAAFQLDWIDHHAALTSYQDSHLQSTYIFAEVRQYYKSSASSDPDLSDPFCYSGGLRVEF